MMHRHYRPRGGLREPVPVPRWALVSLYGLLGLLGVFGDLAGLPLLTQATWRAYTVFWATALAVLAFVAMVGAVRAEWEVVEKWAAVGITSLLLAYSAASLLLTIGSEGHVAFWGRAVLTVLLVIATLLPGIRAVSLLIRTGLHP